MSLATDVLELFADAQAMAHGWRDARAHDLYLSAARRKSLDNAGQHQKRMACPARHAHLLNRKKRQYLARKARRLGSQERLG